MMVWVVVPVAVRVKSGVVVDAYADEVRGGGAGGEVGVAGVDGGEGVEPVMRAAVVKERLPVSGLRGEEGGCAVEEGEGAGGDPAVVLATCVVRVMGVPGLVVVVEVERVVRVGAGLMVRLAGVVVRV